PVASILLQPNEASRSSPYFISVYGGEDKVIDAEFVDGEELRIHYMALPIMWTQPNMEPRGFYRRDFAFLDYMSISDDGRIYSFKSGQILSQEVEEKLRYDIANSTLSEGVRVIVEANRQSRSSGA